MNRVHVVGQHNDIVGNIFINHYIAETDSYEYLSSVRNGGTDRIPETPRETLGYLKASSCKFKLEFIYD